jgi:hypothetical protein
VHQEIEHVREGKHGARSAKQAIAIGLSKARRAGIKLPAPRKGRTSAQTRAQAARDYRKGQGGSSRRPSPKRSRGVLRVLEREGHEAASHRALSRQVHASARRRGSASRRQAAETAVRTKGSAGLAQAAREAARTRHAHR